LCLSARNRRNWFGKELAVYSQLQLGLGAPDSVRCARPASGEQATLRTRRRRTAIIHRTVRWCTGLSGGAPDCPVSRLRRSHRSREEFNVVWLKFTGLSGGAPDYPVSQWSTAPTVDRAIFTRRVDAPTVGRGHRTDRYANCRESATVGCTRKGRRSRTGQLQ
jgi:hypothetical protein